MADEGPISFVLDLDASDFVKSGETALSVIGQLGDPGNLGGLIETLAGAAEALGVVALAAEGFKLALDITVEGEHIQQVENQFNSLSTAAGISTSTLKNGLLQASGGLIDTTSLLQSANKALAELGPSAASLPQVMTLSRQAVTLFGGDVKSTFDEMTQALANGNTRWLKHHGIIIDTNQALAKFAEQNGVAADTLSEAGKRQALFNAGLEVAQKRFAGVAESMGPTTTALQEFKVAWTEIKETIEVMISNVLGPKLTGFFKGVTEMAHNAKTALLAAFGKGDDADTAKIDQLQSKLLDLKGHLADVEVMGKKPGFWASLFGSTAQGDIDLTKSRIQAVQQQIQALEKTKQEAATKDEARTAQAKAEHKAAHQDEIVDAQKLATQKANFKQQELKLEESVDKERIKLIKSVDEVDAEMAHQADLRLQTHEQAVKKIDAEKKQGKLTRAQAAALVHQENMRFEAQEEAQWRADAAERLKLMQQMQQNSKTTWQGFANEAKVSSLKAKQDLADVATHGKKMYDDLSKSGVSAFENIGAAMAQGQNIAQATAGAMKKAFLGFIGETAEHYGEMLLLESVFPPNPVGLAAGAALLAFGGALSGLAGSAGGSSVSTGSASASGSTATAAPAASAASTTQDSTSALQAQQTVQRSVAINIAGNYLNSQESQRTLMEIMRNETDATGFQYNKIGV